MYIFIASPQVATLVHALNKHQHITLACTRQTLGLNNNLRWKRGAIRLPKTSLCSKLPQVGWLTWVTVWSACSPGSRRCVVPPYDLLLSHRPSLLLAEGVAASKRVNWSRFCGENATDFWFVIQKYLASISRFACCSCLCLFFLNLFVTLSSRRDDSDKSCPLPPSRYTEVSFLITWKQTKNVQKCFLLIKCVANTVYSPFPHAKNQCIALQLKLG